MSTHSVVKWLKMSPISHAWDEWRLQKVLIAPQPGGNTDFSRRDSQKGGLQVALHKRGHHRGRLKPLTLTHECHWCEWVRCLLPTPPPTIWAPWRQRGRRRRNTLCSRKWRFSEPVTPCWASWCGESITRWVCVLLYDFLSVALCVILLLFFFCNYLPSDHAQISDLSQVPVPVMLLPDDFKASTKIKVNNHLFNK